MCTKMTHEITNIDWTELARRYTEKFKYECSFEGSSAFLEFHGGSYPPTENMKCSIEVKINLLLTMPGRQPYFVTDSSSTRYILQEDASGTLSYTNNRTGRISPLNPKSIAVGSIQLFNIISDYIEPFVKSLKNS